MTLRPYQYLAVDWAESILPTLPRRTLVLQGPTGCGKTTIMDALHPDLVIAPGLDLCEQLSSRVAGARVMTTQTAARLAQRGKLPSARRIALDEGRWISSAGPWGQVVPWYQAQGTEILIFDATPSTPRGGGLGQWADSLYSIAQVSDLVAEGYLVPWKVHGPSEVVSDLAADPIEVYQWYTPGQSSIVFAANKAHAQGLVGGFERIGVHAALVTDDTPEVQRRRAIRALGDGSIKVAVCAQILRQGIDVPRVSAIFLARAAASIPLYLQAVGRGGRPFAGKEFCWVFDLRGTTHLVGHPEDPRVWSLEGEACRVSEELPPCVQCRQCRAWGRGGSCRFCGASLPPPKAPRVRAKDLIELRTAQDSDEEKKATLERYMRDAQARGYKLWSAMHRYRGKYGSEAPIRWFREIEASLRPVSTQSKQEEIFR